jgi:carbamate kinase
MKTIRQHSEAFKEVIKKEIEINDEGLENAIKYIGENLEPEQVFSEKKLSDWAVANDFYDSRNAD